MTPEKDDPAASANPLLGYDSHDLLEAVDRLDDVRPVISDDGYQPPKIRSRLLKLHGMAMAMKNTSDLSLQGKKQLSRLLTLADDIEMEISGCIDNLERINEVLGKLLSLCSNEEWVDPDPKDDPEED